MELRDTDKLLLAMLSEIHSALQIKNSEFDPKFIMQAIFHDHAWAIRWKYGGLFGDGEEKHPPEVTEVVDILEMWDMIADSIERLAAADKRRVKKDADGNARRIAFAGFDGNHETRHMSIARTFVEQLELFSRFKGMDMNSHCATLARARKMLRVYEPLRANVVDRHGEELLTADEIIELVETN